MGKIAEWSRRFLIGAAIAAICAMPAQAQSQIQSQAQSNGQSPSKPSIQQCTLYNMTDLGDLKLTQSYRQGKPNFYSVQFAPGSYTAMPDGSEYSIGVLLNGEGAFSFRDAQHRFDTDAMIDFRLLLSNPVNRAAALFFSRGDYINIDLGLGKKVLAGDIGGNEAGQRWVNASESNRRLTAFADGESKLGWALSGFEGSDDIIETGSVDLTAIKEARALIDDLAQRFDKVDLRTFPATHDDWVVCS